MSNIFEESCKLPQETRNDMLKAALNSKDENLIKIAIALGAEVDLNALKVAAKLGNVEIIKIILDQQALPEDAVTAVLTDAVNAPTISEEV